MWPIAARLMSFPLLALAVVLLAACAGGDDGPAGPVTAPASTLIRTGDAPPPRFIPVSATVSAGGRVTWMNESPVAHNVIATTSNWQLNRDLPVAGQFSTTIAQPGTYGYECTIHPGMTGTIVVE